NMSSPPKVFANINGNESAIESFNDKLMAQFKLGNVREFTVKGWNNEAVQMWAIYPPNFDAKKKWPLLHSIHGGPHSNWGDNFHFRWNNHVFAAQGYVVVCVNYHGSLGWGNKFLESNNGSFGMKEHADVEAGTDFMLKQGYIDKARLAATGGSYGGKMVALMNGRNGKMKGGDRYKAYVCHAGCFDWRAMYGGDAGYWFDYSLETTYWNDPVKFAAQNPITDIAHAKTPTLVIHGALDYRVPDQQGLAYYATLKSLKVPARLVFFPDENHWILKPQNSRLWFREYFSWLKKYVGAGVS
ncbi:MAG: S9 family peptidase, partial [Pseudomonadota bacterium]